MNRPSAFTKLIAALVFVAGSTSAMADPTVTIVGNPSVSMNENGELSFNISRSGDSNDQNVDVTLRVFINAVGADSPKQAFLGNDFQIKEIELIEVAQAEQVIKTIAGNTVTTGDGYFEFLFEGKVQGDNITKARVTLEATQDMLDEGVQERFQVELRNDDSDQSGNAIINDANVVTATITDDDNAGVTTNKPSIQTNEAGESPPTNQFTVELASIPFLNNGSDGYTAADSAEVTVTVTANGQVTLADDNESGGNSVSLTFNSSNWNTAQTVTATSTNDTNWDENAAYNISVDPSSTDDEIFNANASTANVTGTDINDDVLGTVRLKSAVVVPVNEGDTVNVTVERVCSPNPCAGDVTVTANWAIQTTGDAALPAGQDTPGQDDFTATTFSGSFDLSGTASVIDDSTSFTAADDGAPEAAESFNFNITSVTDDASPGDVSVGDDSRTYTIAANTGNTAAAGTITIVDTNIVADESSAAEGASFVVEIDLMRSGAGDESGSVTVDCQTNDDEAVAPGDFTAIPADTACATWLAAADNGDSGDNSTKTVQVTINNDMDDEADDMEEFTVSFTYDDAASTADNLDSESSAADVFAGGSTTITIVDNDTADDRGDIVVTGAEIVEGDPGDGVSVALTISRVGAAAGPLQVDWDTEEGTATTPEDYADDTTTDTDEATGSVCWMDGSTGAPDEDAGDCDTTIVIQITEDEVSETTNVPETFRVNFSVADDNVNCPAESWCSDDPLINGSSDANTHFVEVSITDDDNPGSISIVSVSPAISLGGDAWQVSEAAGTLTIELERSGGFDGDIDINWNTDQSGKSGDEEDATSDDDYDAANGDLVWSESNAPDASPDGNETIQVTINEDMIDEETGTPEIPFEVFSIEFVTDGGSPTSIPATQIIKIKDNDQPIDTLIAIDTSKSVVEGNNTSVAVTRSGDLSKTSIVAFALADGTAEGDEYSSSTSSPLTFTPGQTLKNISITTSVDADEDDDTFTITLSKPGGASEDETDYDIDPGVSTVTITEQVEGPGQITVTSVNPVEGGVAEVTLTRVGGTQGDVEVTWNTLDGVNADAALSSGVLEACLIDPNLDNTDDYYDDDDSVANPLVWADGDDTGLAKTITIQTNEDQCIEFEERFSVELEVTVGDAPLALESVEIVIQDNDGGGSFSIEDVKVFEQYQKAEVRVTRSGGSEGVVFLFWFTNDGSAVSPGDYEQGVDLLFWPDGDDSSRTITIPIVHDQIEEQPYEEFTITLFNAFSDRPITFTKDTGTVRIFDPVPIPTMSQWGTILMVLLLGGIGYRRIQRQRL